MAAGQYHEGNHRKAGENQQEKIGAGCGANAAQVQHRHQQGDHEGQSSERDAGHPRKMKDQLLDGESGDYRAHQRDNEVVEKHGPARHEAEVRIDTASDVGVCGSRHWVKGCHSSIADGRQHHGHHGGKNRGHGVAV